MKIINPSFVIETPLKGTKILKWIEKCIRLAYKSEDKITSRSARSLIRKILSATPPHESTIEHFGVSVRMVCDRGITHEIVRHRLASYTQESTRYCNYSKGKFGNQITVIKPIFWSGKDINTKKKFDEWVAAMNDAERHYMNLINFGAKPEEARSVLPNSLKTEIIMTANLREWRHFFKMRTSKRAHPQMREITLPMLREFQEKIPVIFDDIVPIVGDHDIKLPSGRVVTIGDVKDHVCKVYDNPAARRLKLKTR